MPGPFPGMDPWLERPWMYADLRFTMVVLLNRALNALLPDGYVAAIRHITEDIGSVDAESYVAILELRDRDEDDVALTAIELPERHRGWRDCRVKGEWSAGRVLIRLFRDPWAEPCDPSLAPQITTRRFGDTERADIETLDYRKPLPSISVPWRIGEPDLIVPLQPLLDHAYEIDSYAKRAKYATKHPDPPLTPEQRVWAEGILREKGVLK